MDCLVQRIWKRRKVETTPEWESITSFRRVEKNDIQQCYRNCRSKSAISIRTDRL
jgi:hypothetical protein